MRGADTAKRVPKANPTIVASMAHAMRGPRYEAFQMGEQEIGTTGQQKG
jgi:hypothetical protein